MNLHDGYGVGKSWQEVFEVEHKESLEYILNKLNVTYTWKPNGLLFIEEIVSPIIKHPITGEKVFFSQADQWHPSSLNPKVLSALLSIMPAEDFYHNCYYGDGSEISIEDLHTIRKLINQEMVTFQWKKDDILMLDNIISMHGRLPFKGERKILVAMTD